MKNVLIISDNYRLAKALSEIIRDQNLNSKVNFKFKYSKTNKSPDNLINLGYSSIDVKDSETILKLVSEYQLILSLHCKQIFPADLVSKVLCINLHPGYNPFNRGWYPQVFSIINKKPVGATFHVMNEDVDAGPIIVQNLVDIYSYDTSNSLYDRIQDLEIEMLKNHLASIINFSFKSVSPTELGNYNSPSDFRKLCKIDLNHVGTFSEHLNYLRALTHSGFKNAYFIDPSGAKIYVELVLKADENR